MSVLLYNLIIFLYRGIVSLAAPFHRKARAWIGGRANFGQQMETLHLQRPRDGRKVVWLHASSLGEFEQGRPVIEGLRRERQDLWVALTFFSPSGFEQKHDYPGADWTGYLPLDTARKASRFVETLQPHLVLWVKYDLWYYHLQACFVRKIPVVLFAMNLSPRHPVFRTLTQKLYQHMLLGMDHIFVQFEEQRHLARKAGIERVGVAADPRIDRVKQIALEAEALPEIEQFLAGENRVLILGSAYATEVALTLAAHWRDFFDRLIVAPHYVDEKRLRQLAHKLGTAQVLRYANAGAPSPGKDILLIDQIGLLSRLYRYGSVAFVGGGFGYSIHNTLEPAAFSLPVMFGPAHERFPEAQKLLEEGGFFEVNDAAQVRQVWQRLSNAQAYFRAREKVQDFMVRHEGGSSKVVRHALRHLDASSSGT